VRAGSRHVPSKKCGTTKKQTAKLNSRGINESRSQKIGKDQQARNASKPLGNSSKKTDTRQKKISAHCTATKTEGLKRQVVIKPVYCSSKPEGEKKKKSSLIIPEERDPKGSNGQKQEVSPSKPKGKINKACPKTNLAVAQSTKKRSVLSPYERPTVAN